MAAPHGTKLENACKVLGSPHCADRYEGEYNEHTAAGRIPVHALNGHMRLQLPERVVDLPAGHLLALDQCVPHDVEAAEDSVFLLTLSWPPETNIAEANGSRKRTTRRKRK